MTRQEDIEYISSVIETLFRKGKRELFLCESKPLRHTKNPESEMQIYQDKTGNCMLGWVEYRWTNRTSKQEIHMFADMDAIMRNENELFIVDMLYVPRKSFGRFLLVVFDYCGGVGKVEKIYADFDSFEIALTAYKLMQ